MPFEIGEALVAAGVDEVLAHHQGGIAVARLDRRLISHDLHEDAAPDRVVEARRHGAAADV
jgi:hypothetical protein